MPRSDRLALGAVAALLAGVALMGHGCTRFLGGGGHVYGAEVAEGRVVQVRDRKVDFGRNRGLATVREVVVEFPVGPRKVRVEDTSGRIGAERDMGSVVPVYYDPYAPERAQLGGTEPFSGVQYVIEWLLGAVTILAAAALLVRARRTQAKEPR